MVRHVHEPVKLDLDKPATVPIPVSKQLMVQSLVFGVPALLFAVIGGFVIPSIANLFIEVPPSYFSGAMAGVIIWTSVLIGIGIRINTEQEFTVIERLGRFKRMKPRGMYLLWLPGLLDKIRCKDTFQAREVPLYEGPDNLIDFTDASSPIEASAWYHIANPADVQKKDWKRVQAQVTRWVYTADEPETLLASILEGNLRPLLQAHSTDSAQLECESCADQAVEESRDALEHIGAYPRPVQAIVIKDIKLPADVEELRQLRLEGQAKAQREENESKGLAAAIRAIQRAAREGENGTEISWAEAQGIYERQQTREMIQGTGSNITLVAPNVDGVFKMVELGGSKS